MTGPSSYSGGTTVAGGSLFIDNANNAQSSTGIGNVTVNGGTFGGVGNVGVPNFAAANVNVSAGATLYAGLPRVGAVGPVSGTLNVTGNLNLAAGANLQYDFAPSGDGLVTANDISLPSSGTVAVNVVIGDMSGNQTFPIMQAGLSNYSAGVLTLGAHPTNYSFSFSSDGSSYVNLNATYLGPANLTWVGGNGNIWGNAARSFSGGMSDGSLGPSNNGDLLTFNDSAGSANSSITVLGSESPASMTFSNAAVAYTLSGGTITVGTISGAGSATISTNVLNLTGPGGVANNVTLFNSGNVNVTGGTHTVAALGDVVSYTTAGTTTVSNATLKAGALYQDTLNINAGGAIALTTAPTALYQIPNYANTLNLNGGLLDVQSSGINLRNSSPAAVYAAIQQSATTGYTAASGITSSTLAKSNTAAYGVGYVPNYNGGLYTLVAAAQLGDASLQGTVTSTDLELVSGSNSNLYKPNVGWTGGDFYYQGYVTPADRTATVLNLHADSPGEVVRPLAVVSGGAAEVLYNNSTGALVLAVSGAADFDYINVAMSNILPNAEVNNLGSAWQTPSAGYIQALGQYSWAETTTGIGDLSPGSYLLADLPPGLAGDFAAGAVTFGQDKENAAAISDSVSVVPEPGSLALLTAAALLCGGACALRRRAVPQQG